MEASSRLVTAQFLVREREARIRSIGEQQLFEVSGNWRLFVGLRFSNFHKNANLSGDCRSVSFLQTSLANRLVTVDNKNHSRESRSKTRTAENAISDQSTMVSLSLFLSSPPSSSRLFAVEKSISLTIDEIAWNNPDMDANAINTHCDERMTLTGNNDNKMYESFIALVRVFSILSLSLFLSLSLSLSL